MKTTASLMDIIQTELINNGLNEFVNKVDGVPQITKNDDKFTFIRKVAQYDDDVQTVVNRTFFMNFKFQNAKADLFFKRSFITRFLDRQIGNQTVDLFANHLVGQMITDEPFIINLYENMDKYLISYNDNTNVNNTNSISDVKNENETNSNATSNSDTHDGFNRANADLPQDNTDLDLNKNSVDYANNTDVNRGYNNNKSNTVNNEQGNTKTNTISNDKTNSSGNATSYNADVLDKLNVQWDNLFNKYDKKLFLQVW